jgi:large subunit ribosomal protein L17
MKKKVFGRKLSRDHGSRKALFRSLVRALVIHGSIKTTKAKAKAIQADVDKFINLAKADSIAKRRQLYKVVGNDRKTTDAIFEIIKSRFLKRSGGYTRIINLPVRRGDAAEMVKLKWVEESGIKDKRKSDKSKKKVGKKKAVGGKIKSKLSRKNKKDLSKSEK